MTELEAMNMLLRLIGSSPVNSLSTPHPDAANAKVTLDRIRKQFQRKGWWFNVDYKITMNPDSNDEIKLPSTYSTVIFQDSSLIKRGKYVYNKIEQTNKMYQPVIIERAVNTLDWDELPQSVQEYCAYFAGSQFIRDELEDPQKEANLQQSATQVLIDIRQQDLEESKFNMFNKRRVLQARAGVSPYSRGTQRFFGTPDA
ncbi:MAG: putative tail tubular protein [Prokaryotic dsDNA virus sp.]|nr:MAG: putative tail tubular protein [Prokaryotic dsDNA virus sp.]QDP66080.1 MAG: putative tail tubular protein [Prokaryotic dsDNA virus sp.]